MVFKALKRRSIQQLAHSMALPEQQESTKNKYLGHCMLFKLENQRSHRTEEHYLKAVAPRPRMRGRRSSRGYESPASGCCTKLRIFTKLIVITIQYSRNSVKKSKVA